MVTKATEEDKENDYKGAVKHYLDGVGYLLDSVKCESKKNLKLKKSYKIICQKLVCSKMCV